MKLGLIISSLLYFVTLMLMGNQGCNGCLEKERIGLLEIKHYILSREDSKQLASWVDDRGSNCCSWNRVKCSNTTSGHITELSIEGLIFESLHLHMLNVSLFRPFEELRFLDLSENWFGGWIGNEGFPGLTKLETLDLSLNLLDSSILPSLNGLTALTTLNLANNKMENFSAQGFPRLTKLETLDLSMNLLDSSILSSLNGLTALTTLNIADNKMENFSAQGFPRLTKLETLDLSYNYLNSSILPSLNGLTALTTLNLADNKMENFSAQGFPRLTKLETLDLSLNLLDSSILPSLNGLTALTTLNLANNKMENFSAQDHQVDEVIVEE